ncbi:MAG: hypothetical protein QXJ17_03980 [Nitrososphaeria archaeon]
MVELVQIVLSGLSVAIFFSLSLIWIIGRPIGELLNILLPGLRDLLVIFADVALVIIIISTFIVIGLYIRNL